MSLLASLFLFPEVNAAGDGPVQPGAPAWQRCAVCHLAGAEGIPGAYPPLKGRIATIASSDLGRKYLVAVLGLGLAGRISIDGILYQGAMPAQASTQDHQDIADVLNYTIEVIDATGVEANWRPFSAEEVRTILGNGDLKTIQDSARLRSRLFGRQ